MPAGVYELDKAAFSENKPPWWINGEGMKEHAVVLPEGQKMYASDVNEIAGLNWAVEKVPAYVGRGVDDNGEPCFEVVPREYWTIRADTGTVLGRVGENYRVYQNEDAPQFLNYLVDSGEAFFDTAGSLFNNKVVWWLMKLPGDIIVAGDERERTERYIAFRNSHDGSGSITVAYVLLRIVCANTLAWAFAKAPRTFNVRHTENMNNRVADAKKALEIAYKYDEKYQEQAERLLDYQLTDEKIYSWLDQLVPVKDEKGEPLEGRGLTIANNTRSSILGLYAHAPNLNHLPMSAYRFVQAVEEHSQHAAVFRNTQVASAWENRFKKVIDGKTLGAEAYQIAAKELIAA